MKRSKPAADSALADELRSYISALMAIKLRLPKDAEPHGEIASCVDATSVYLDKVSAMSSSDVSTVATWCLALQNRCQPLIQPETA